MLDTGERLSPSQGRSSASRPRARSTTPTGAASSTATSSPPTSCSTRTASCASPTSGSPGRSPRRRGPSPPARCSAPRATPRPSRPRARRSTGGPTSIRSASCSSRRAPARCRSWPTPRSPRSWRVRTRRHRGTRLARSAARRSSARAGKPSPADRYPDAAAMGAALATQRARVLPPPEPLDLPGLGGAVEDPEPTRFAPTAKFYDQDEATKADDAPDDDAFPMPEPNRRSVTRRSLVPFCVIGAILVALVAGVGASWPRAQAVVRPSRCRRSSDRPGRRQGRRDRRRAAHARHGAGHVRRPEGSDHRAAPEPGVVPVRGCRGRGRRVARPTARRRCPPSPASRSPRRRRRWRPPGFVVAVEARSSTRPSRSTS